MRLHQQLLSVFMSALLLAGCEDPVDVDIDPELVGTYHLLTYRGWPLPYFDVPFLLQGGTLELLPNGRFIKSDSVFNTWEVVEGEYYPRGWVALVDTHGATLSFEAYNGFLRHRDLLYMKEGRERLPEHRWRKFRLVSCDDVVPNSTSVPCPGSGGLYSSMIWLRDNLRIDFSDYFPGATFRGDGRYQLDGETLAVQGLDARRAAGTLRDGVLTFGGWVYHEVP